MALSGKIPLPTLVDKNNVKFFLDSFDTLMTDCDGVLWTGDEVLDRANLALNKLKQMGKKIFLVTNNSTKSREEYTEKCAKLGFNANKDEIVSSASVMASYIKKSGFNKKVYLIGTSGVGQELDNIGVKHIGIGPDPLTVAPFELVKQTTLDPEVGAVVVAFDGHISLPKILKAASYLSSVPDCLFLASNTDESVPVLGTSLVYPGTGCMVAAVETVAGRKATIMGKPEPRMFEVIRDQSNAVPERTLMVGDRCNTDILLGSNCGLLTMLVLTGVHQLSDVEGFAASDDKVLQGQVPKYYLPTFGTLLDLIE